MYKILMIAPTPFFADRGCHVRIYGEVRVLQNMGNKVSIYTYHNGRNLPGLDIKRIVNIPWYNKLEAGPSYHKFYLDILLLLKSLEGGTYERPDIIHAHLHEGAFLGNIVAKFRNIPLVFDFQGSLSGEIIDHNFLKKKSIFLNLFKKVEKFINNSADAIIISSLDSAVRLQNGFGVSADKLYMIKDGIDTEKFKPDECHSIEIRRKLRISDNRKIIIYQGLLNKYQGIDFLLQTIPLLLKKNKGVHFLIIGYPNVDEYRNMAREKGIEDFITFIGRVNYEDTAKYLSLADIAVSAKLSKTEWNGKLLYYMASELPTVVFDTKVNREILGDLGVYAKLDNPTSFAEGIGSLLSEERVRRRLGISLRERVIKNYSWKSVGKKIMEVYQELLARGRN
ncbi:MAG: glycosyltransferase [Clostridia bacterium]|nr:glycosyltransferase [Clostridia bacterium]